MAGTGGGDPVIDTLHGPILLATMEVSRRMGLSEKAISGKEVMSIESLQL
jgi:hypothetical protein